MKRIAFYFLIASLLLVIGLSLVWFLNARQKEEVLVVQPVITSTTIPQNERPKFLPTARGCGYGYAQSYELPDGQTMSEGSVGYPSKERTRKEYKEWLAKASSIVERVPKFENRFGNKGERIVALFLPDASRKQWATIFWYDGGRYFTYIQAPTKELALEFEKSNAYAY